MLRNFHHVTAPARVGSTLDHAARLARRVIDGERDSITDAFDIYRLQRDMPSD